MKLKFECFVQFRITNELANVLIHYRIILFFNLYNALIFQQGKLIEMLK